ncbi:large subunit ribosomal protein L18 [Thiohalospira halophila DSM 15071]|uniref:Large ribosomal subunit protein uL18 n=1 Tax=Thiohalospira halophila DSM 15071 TaxID=1123397 RepID=A0A1I1Q1H1_9GAMM|nr:50S ribosomal protein L18 [Thiohalospira halophila]SFD13708.1 large subunit ribosomal protein L18 [Thiohalospira halophila DSM 15071]
MDKKTVRLRRARRGRAKIRELGMHRLCVHRTPRHIYAQVIAPDGGTTVAASSTVETEMQETVGTTGNSNAAAAVGRAIAEKAKGAGVTKVAFDRSGFQYHGRIRALADAARENGLEF